jgi:mRNA interferase RelE/StbE
MGYRVIVPKRVRKELGSLPKAAYARAREQIKALHDDPCPSGVKKLEGSASTYRVRVGDYRILYKVNDSAKEVHLLRVGDRKDVYRP